jgi:DNA-3-methyladenine glycosylase
MNKPLKRKILSKKFYAQDTLQVAQELLGCFLAREYRGKIWRVMITETEAYAGEDDLASHASRGRTPRTELMYGEPGRAYVYIIYGMYHCLNIVTGEKGFPAAVLIRGMEIENVDHKKTNGPGKLCKFLKIDRKLNGWDITKGEKLWIARPEGTRSRLGRKERNLKIIKSKRIGVDYAKHCKEYLWRFQLKTE